MPERRDLFEPVDTATAARWQKFAPAGAATFPALLGLVVEEVRHGYCRMRLPVRPEVRQGNGLVHGGAIASLLDSALVPAIGVTLPVGTVYSTVDLHVQFIAAAADDDAVAEGWILHQGRGTIFGQSEARAATTGRLLATALLTFNVRDPA